MLANTVWSLLLRKDMTIMVWRWERTYDYKTYKIYDYKTTIEIIESKDK